MSNSVGNKVLKGSSLEESQRRRMAYELEEKSGVGRISLWQENLFVCHFKCRTQHVRSHFCSSCVKETI